MSDEDDRITVLLADDSAPIREMLRMLLSLDPRFSVVGEADDGVGAVEMAKQHRPDVVLLDIAMPRMDGLQALAAIKADDATVKVVILSAFGAEEIHAKATEGGADAYIEKGAPLGEITDTIVRVCST